MVHQTLFIFWNDTGTQAQALAERENMTTIYMASLKTVTPDSGAYMSEADPFDPDWKATFYGSNYDKLLAIKDKWDPDEMLYGSTAVGGDRWTQAADGRLCKA